MRLLTEEEVAQRAAGFSVPARVAVELQKRKEQQEEATESDQEEDPS